MSRRYIYTSQTKEYKRLYYLKIRDRRNAELRRLYKADPARREKLKAHARNFYKSPIREERRKVLRKAQYQKHAHKNRARSRRYYRNDKARFLRYIAEYRRKHRDLLKAKQRLAYELLSDKHVRSRLSKVSTNRDWTTADVAAKRLEILKSRKHRAHVMKSVPKIRRLYASGFSTVELAKRFKMSIRSVGAVVHNESYPDPSYTPSFFKNHQHLSKTMRLIDGASKLNAL